MRVRPVVKRFQWMTSVTGWAVGAVGTGLAVITAARESVGLRLVNSLLILVVVAVSALSLVRSAIGRDIDQLQADVNEGFERVADALDDAGDVRPDGGSATAATGSLAGTVGRRR